LRCAKSAFCLFIIIAPYSSKYQRIFQNLEVPRSLRDDPFVPDYDIFYDNKIRYAKMRDNDSHYV